MRTKIIVLQNNQLSQTVAQDCIEQAAKFGITAEVFDAINGFDASRHLELLNIKPLGKFKKGRVGIVGCLLSHYYLWLDCVKHNVPYLVLEHDGYFIKPLPDNILDLFDDVIKLDSGNPYKDSYEQWLATHSNDASSIWTIHDDEHSGGTGEAAAGWYTLGAYAYIIKPHAAVKLIDWVKTQGFLPTDWLLGTKIVSVSHHCPSIARLHPLYAKDGNIKKLSTTMNLEN